MAGKRKAIREKSVDDDSEFSGARTVRRSGVVLQSTVNTFMRPDSRTVTIVSTFNVGEPQYFRALREVVDNEQRMGATVFATKLHGLVENGSDERERNLMAALLGGVMRRRHLLRAAELPWVIQDDSMMCLQPDWVNVDVPLLEFVRMVGDEPIQGKRPLLSRSWLVKRLPSRTQATLHARRMVFTGKDIYKQKQRFAPWFDRVAAWREHTIASAILGVSGDVVISCDPSMTRGLGRTLLRNTFDLVSSEWHTVGRLPKR